MVEDALADGKRIAQLIASEIEGHEASLADLSVTDADPDVEPTPDGAFAYAVVRGDERVAEVVVYPDHARVAFLTGRAAATEAAESEGLRVEPAAGDSDRTLVYVETGAQAKRVVRAFEAL
ncbi:hypothetical protein ACFQJD_12160 [Haloplanus sp. GCM10025708]|uniref:hypothetical protein n=1 Tax=Haloferacaceae TaxID=1644056 RepID=UPI003606FEC1